MKNVLMLYTISLVSISILVFCGSDEQKEKHKKKHIQTTTNNNNFLERSISTTKLEKKISTTKTSATINLKYSFNDSMIGKKIEIKGILKDFRTDKRNVYLFIDKIDASSIQFYISIYNEKLKRKAFLMQYEKVKIKGILQKASKDSIARYKLQVGSIEKP